MLSPTITPQSAIRLWPENTVSVVLSPLDADAYTYPQFDVADCIFIKSSLYLAFPIVSLLADKFTIIFAPCKQWYFEGGIGTQTSSQISAETTAPVRVSSTNKFGVNGTVFPPITIWSSILFTELAKYLPS